MFLWVILTLVFFFFNDTATTEIYTLSLHDALPICAQLVAEWRHVGLVEGQALGRERSEEHTSELQSRSDLVCRLLLEKKKLNRFLERKNKLNYNELINTLDHKL